MNENGTDLLRTADPWLLVGCLVLAVGVVGGAWVIPWWYYAISAIVTAVIGIPLLTMRYWPRLFRRSLTARLPIPRGVLLGILVTMVITAAAVRVFSLVPRTTVSVALVIGGLLTITGGALSDERTWVMTAYPIWTVLVLLLAGLLLVKTVIGTIQLLTIVLVGALVLFAVQVWLVIPLALYHRLHESRPRANEPYEPVSVLIPAYNEEGFVGECIESVLTATYPRDLLEVIVIDDGSEDGTYAEASRYREAGIRVLQRNNGGKHAALNFGLLCATGDIIVTIDADSYVAPDAIEMIVGQFQEDSDIGGLAGTVHIENDDTHLTKLQALEYAFSIQTFRRMFSLFGVVSVLPGCLAAFRRQAIEEVGGFDPDTLTEDFDITVKILKRGWRTVHSPARVWTHAPETWGDLWTQRKRWYGGNLETMLKHRDAFTDPDYGFLHLLVLPTNLLTHFFIPPASFLVLVAVGIGLVIGPTVQVAMLGFLFLFLTMLLVLVAIRMDDARPALVGYAPLFFIGYKQIIETYVVASTWESVRRDDRKW